MIKKRTRPSARVREPSPAVENTEATTIDEEVTLPLEDLIELRKWRRSRQGIDVGKLNKGEVRRRKRKVDEDTIESEGGLTTMGTKKEAEAVEEDEEEANEAKARRTVRSNNFTQQTNALDVDKHMMAYIEENLKLLRGDQDPREEVPKERPYDPDEELFRLPEQYRLRPGASNEGNVTNSLAMLTAIPEVDLGMDTRLKNIEETEKAKRAVADERKERGKSTYNDEEHLTAARFYKPNVRQKSDADILRAAKLEAMGLPPEDYEPRRSYNDRNQTATDDAVMERFKKRMRK